MRVTRHCWGEYGQAYSNIQEGNIRDRNSIVPFTINKKKAKSVEKDSRTATKNDQSQSRPIR